MKKFFGLALAVLMLFCLVAFSASAVDGDVAVVNGKSYASLTEAVKAGGTITLLDDVNEDITISKKVTIDGAGNTYTGKMTLKADTTIKNVNFDGKGYNGYALETRGAQYLTIEDCTAKNYGYGFVQLASATALTTVKDVVISNVNYGIKVDYSGKVVVENADITAAVAGILNSNYGEKTIVVKDSKINIYGTWARNNTTKTTILFEGNNTVDQFITDDAIDTFKLAADATLKAVENLAVTTDAEGYEVLFADGIYSAVKAARVAEVNGEEYRTLAQAITAAKSGDTITLLDDVNENVTIGKNLTLDGAGYNYTGEMNFGKGFTITVKNVDFVNGGITNVKNTTGKYTITDCTFDGCDKKYNYALTIKGANTLKIENCTAKDYSYGFLYVSSSLTNHSIKNVTVENCNYGARLGSTSTSNFENFVTKNVKWPVVIQANAKRTVNLTNCSMENSTDVLSTWGGTSKVIFNFKGINDLGVVELPAATNLVYNGVQVGTKIYSSLKAAVEAAEDGDTIKLVGDITLSNEDVCAKVSGMYPYVSVTDKKLTIDLNGKTVTVNPSLDANMLAVFHTGANGELVLTDSSADMSGAVNVTMADGTQAYSMFTALGSSKMTIEAGNYYIDKVEYGQSMLYAGQSEQLVVNGGNFVLGDAHTRPASNGQLQPWIVNAHGDGTKVVILNGGTYNVDPTHYHGEARFPNCYKAVEIEEGVWGLEYAATVEIDGYGYWTIKDAVAAAKDGDVITFIKDYEIENSEFETCAAYSQFDSYIEIFDKDITIDFNGKKLTAIPELEKVMSSIFFVGNTGALTLKDSSEAQVGGLAVTTGENTKAYSLIFVDGNQSKLSIESGDYYIDKIEEGYSMIYGAQTGTTSVSGGNFVLGNAGSIVGQGNVMIPWIFNTWQNGVNFVEVTGGTYNVNPQNHWNEVNFPAGCFVYETAEGQWKVGNGPIIITQPISVSAKKGDTVSVSVEAIGDGLTYRWYSCNANSSKFSGSSIRESVYSVEMTTARSGRKVYCVITDAAGNKVVSDTVTLTELRILNNGELEDAYYAAKGEEINIKVEAQGEGLTYKWYSRNVGAAKFSASSTLTTDTYTVAMSAARSGREIYCVVTDAFGNKVQSKVITLYMS